jgi:hypothetical protein
MMLSGVSVQQVWAAEPSVMVMGLNGEQSLTATNCDAAKEYHEGQLIPFMCTITAGKKAPVFIALEQGVSVLLAPDSAVHFTEEAGLAVGDKVSSLELESGAARILVKKSENTEEKPMSYKFMMRSRAAVLGIRGTEFIVSAKDSSLSLNTLDGVVDAGATVESIMKAPLMVEANYSANMENNKNFPAKTQKFEASQFLKQFNSKYPKMEAAWKTVVQETNDGTVKKRFQALSEVQQENVAPSQGVDLKDAPAEIEYGKKKAKK